MPLREDADIARIVFDAGREEGRAKATESEIMLKIGVKDKSTRRLNFNPKE
jgi:hypothetical protein